MGKEDLYKNYRITEICVNDERQGTQQQHFIDQHVTPLIHGARS